MQILMQNETCCFQTLLFFIIQQQYCIQNEFQALTNFFQVGVGCIEFCFWLEIYGCCKLSNGCCRRLSRQPCPFSSSFSFFRHSFRSPSNVCFQQSQHCKSYLQIKSLECAQTKVAFGNVKGRNLSFRPFDFLQLHCFLKFANFLRHLDMSLISGLYNICHWQDDKKSRAALLIMKVWFHLLCFLSYSSSSRRS